MVVMKYLKDYVEDGRYTIIVGSRMKSLMFKIKELYPKAVVTTSDADGIGGKKLLVDKWVADGLGLEAALPKYRDEDIVCENFTKQFVEGRSENDNLTITGYEEPEQTLNIIADTLDKRLTKEDVSFDLNGEVPKLYIKGQEVGVVSMTNHYVTRDDIGRGSSTTTFMYMVKGHPDHKVLSINQTTGEVFNQ